MKILENQRFCGVYREYKMGTMVTNSLKWCEITLNSILHFKAPFDDFGN